jgi:hypothetical protein
MRLIKNRNEFLEKCKNNKIDEALSNEVNWGDSLLGRLINSTIRKVSIANNLRNISGLLENLETEFDRLSELIKISGESMNIVNKIIYKTEFSQHLKDIEESINDGDSVDELIKLTNSKIQIVKSSKTDYEEVESLRKEFIRLLEKFIEFLESLKNSGEGENLDDEKKSDDGKDKEQEVLALQQGNIDRSEISKFETDDHQILKQIETLFVNINKIRSEKVEGDRSLEFKKIWRELQKELTPSTPNKILPQEIREDLSKKLNEITKNNNIKSLKEFKEKVDLLIKKYSELNRRNKAKENYNRLLQDYKKVEVKIQVKRNYPK